MPTLSAANSVFQLACGVNAVVPVLVSDFEAVRKEAAESFLRKLKEHCPNFELKEQDREDFIDFNFRSTAGLRHAYIITRVMIALSLVLCGISLAFLCAAAVKPEYQISTTVFWIFVAITLIAGPLLYVARNEYLKWLYRILAIHSGNEKREAELFAGCVQAYLRFNKQWQRRKVDLNEATADIPVMIWKLRWTRFRMKLTTLWLDIRTKFRTILNR